MLSEEKTDTRIYKHLVAKEIRRNNIDRRKKNSELEMLKEEDLVEGLIYKILLKEIETTILSEDTVNEFSKIIKPIPINYPVTVLKEAIESPEDTRFKNILINWINSRKQDISEQESENELNNLTLDFLLSDYMKKEFNYKQNRDKEKWILSCDDLYKLFMIYSYFPDLFTAQNEQLLNKLLSIDDGHDVWIFRLWSSNTMWVINLSLKNQDLLEVIVSFINKDSTITKNSIKKIDLKEKIEELGKTFNWVKAVKKDWSAIEWRKIHPAFYIFGLPYIPENGIDQASSFFKNNPNNLRKVLDYFSEFELNSDSDFNWNILEHLKNDQSERQLIQFNRFFDWFKNIKLD